MSEKQSAYEAKLAEITAISRDLLKFPTMPVDTYVKEANGLYSWASEDKTALTSAGIDWPLVEDLVVRADALSYAQALWQKVMYSREEAQEQWNLLSPAGYDLRDVLLHYMQFAFRGEHGLSTTVDKIAEGRGDADMIQDLTDVEVLARDNMAALIKLGLDPAEIDRAAQMSKELGMLRGEATADKAADSETKLVRDQAYTHLKEAVDTVRDLGQFVFWRTEERLVGYRSEYFNKKASKSTASSDATPSQGSPDTV